MTTTGTIPSEADLAEVLFVSTLQESEAPTADQVRAVIEHGLNAWKEDCTACLACVAQEAGDHPDAFARRMHWALATVHSVFGGRAG
jgi:hypothetical protein